MKEKKKIKFFVGIFFIGAFFIFVTIGGAHAAKKVVNIGIIAHLTGPYGPGTRGIMEGCVDAAEAVNKYEPIPGIELKAVWVDGASSPAKSMSALKKMVSQHHPVVVVGWTTPSALATKGYYIKKKIPSIEGGGADPLWELPSWTFSAMAPYQNRMGAWVDYYLKNIWPEKGKNRAPNFAWVTWDNAAGRASITDKTKAYVKSRGVNIMPGNGEFFPIAPTEISAQMMRLKKNEVDFTYGLMLFPTAAAVLKGANKMGLIDRIDFGISTPNPPDLIRQAGPLCRNVYADDYWWPPREWPQKCPRILEIYNAKGRQKLPRFLWGAGLGWGLVAAEAVRMAAQDVGPDNVTGEAVYNALKRMKDYKRWDIGVPVGFGKKKRYGLDGTILYRLNDSRVNSVAITHHPNLTKFEF